MTSISVNNLKNIVSAHKLSQESLAEILGVSRPTVAKMLAGTREIKMSEAKKLAEVLGITTSEVFGEARAASVVIEKKAKKAGGEMRVSVPEENAAKFKNALLYITQKIGALPNVGQTVLYKILYFCDFDYYEKYEEQLIGARYIRNYYGPTPVEFRAIVSQMVSEESIEEVKTRFYNKDQTKYLPVVQPDLSVFSGQELKHIDDEIERLGHKTAKELSDYSHKDVPWIATAEGQEIPYESVFYRTPETSVRQYDDTVNSRS